MARPRGRPKIVGKWRYIIQYGSPQIKQTVVKDTPTEVKRRLERIFNSQRDHANRYATTAEYNALISLVQSFNGIRDEDFERRLVYRWSIVGPGGATIILEATVDRVPYEQGVTPDAKLL